ncbi:MAG TPA: hypothetical protein VJA21_14950 [Verrucomicrobiae bacterium]
MSYLSLLRLVAPETILAVSALVVLMADVLYLRDAELHVRMRVGAMVASVGCLAAIGWMLALPEFGSFMQGMLVLDAVRRVVRVGILVLAILTILVAGVLRAHRGSTPR